MTCSLIYLTIILAVIGDLAVSTGKLLEVDRVHTLLIHYWEDGRIYMPGRHRRSTNHATTLSRI